MTTNLKKLIEQVKGQSWLINFGKNNQQLNWFNQLQITIESDYIERKEEAIKFKSTKGRDFTIDEPPLPDGHTPTKIYC